MSNDTAIRHAAALVADALAQPKGAETKPFANFQSLDDDTFQPMFQALVDQGELLTSSQLAEKLGITRQQVNNRRDQGVLLAVEGFRRGYLFPAWHAELRLSKVLPQVLEGLKHVRSWDVFSFLRATYPALGGKTPIDLLREGQTQRVVEFAEVVFGNKVV
jgi:hypothetical protein